MAWFCRHKWKALTKTTYTRVPRWVVSTGLSLDEIDKRGIGEDYTDVRLICSKCGKTSKETLHGNLPNEIVAEIADAKGWGIGPDPDKPRTGRTQ